jgi:cytochrome c oxidase subunit III
MSPGTRNSQATGPAEVAQVALARRSLPNGWWGMLLFVAAEATLFGTLIASYFYLRFQAATWPPPGIEPPAVTLPLVLTAVLVATTAPVLGAWRSVRAGRGGGACALIVAATLVQAGYIVAQALLFEKDLRSFSPRGSAYGSVYFTLLGVHHAHVIVGILLNIGVLTRLLGGLTSYRTIGVRTLALYWSFVSTAAIAVVLTQLSPALL